MNFVYANQASRVRFGLGARNQLSAELDALGWQRVMVIATEREAELAREVATDPRVIVHYDDARVHVPQATVEAAMALATANQIDATVSVGGGSTVGLSKMLSLNLGLPSLAIPTTYAGSEMTPIWGTTLGDEKTTGKDPQVKPQAIIYDPELTLTLPMAITGPSALNAMAHAIEALWAVDANPITDLMALEGIRALGASLPVLAGNNQDLEARAGALYGAWLCGTVLGQCSMALHHKLCHVLGGTYNLPHADVHALVLPYALAYNAPGVPEAMQKIADALGCEVDLTANYLKELALELGAPTSLEAMGVRADQLGRAVELASKNPYANPVAITADGIHALITQIHRGDSPITEIK